MLFCLLADLQLAELISGTPSFGIYEYICSTCMPEASCLKFMRSSLSEFLNMDNTINGLSWEILDTAVHLYNCTKQAGVAAGIKHLRYPQYAE
jgi:hypothetical protein